MRPEMPQPPVSLRTHDPGEAAGRWRRRLLVFA